MPRKIVVVICSREKSREPGLLPAVERYTGSHIAYVADIAKGIGRVPFFILSGKFGLVAEREGIHDYDYLLTMQDVARMTGRVASQLSGMGVREIYFYTKTKDSWQPYRELMEQAAQRVGARLITYKLKKDL